MIVHLLPLFVCLVGLLAYLLSSSARAQQLGLACFAVGLLALLLGAPGLLLTVR